MTVTLTATYQDGAGMPCSGRVVFRLAEVNTAGSIIYMDAPVGKVLDASGALSVVLQATDTMTESASYEVRELINGSDERVYYVELPSSPSTTNLAALRAYTSAPVPYGQPVSHSALSGLSADGHLGYELRHTFDVTRYGALGDGVTDDRAAIDTASSAATAVGGIVYFPPGTYLVGNYVTLRTGVTYQGAGIDVTTIKLKNSAGTNVMDNPAGSRDRVVIADLTVDGNKANNTAGDGITMPAFTNSTIRNVKVKNPYNRGINLFNNVDTAVVGCLVTGAGGGSATTNGTKSGIYAQGGTRLRIDGNTVTGSADSGILATSSAYTRLVGNAVYSTTYIGIGLGSGSAHATITGNVVHSCTDNGIDIGNSTDSAIGGNTIYSCGQGIVGDTAARASIGGNTIDTTTATDAGAAGAGIQLTGAGTHAGHTITGNTVRLAGGHGIALYNASHATITGNLVVNSSTVGTGKDGISVGGNTTVAYVTMTGNRCYDDRGTKRQTYGVRTYNAGTDYCLAVGNALSGNLTGAITMAGANNVNANNLTA